MQSKIQEFFNVSPEYTVILWKVQLQDKILKTNISPWCYTGTLQLLATRDSQETLDGVCEKTNKQTKTHKPPTNKNVI